MTSDDAPAPASFDGLVASRWIARWLTWIGMAACLTATQAQEASTPLLQLEPGAHWAPVRRIAISADQRLVATASDDKTVRIWLRDKRTPTQILRPDIGEGANGRVYGVAFHPAQSLVAIGGTGPGGNGRIGLYRPETGELLLTWQPPRGEVKRLAWSADGRWLVAAFASPGGVRVYSANGAETARVDYAGDTYGLDLNAQGMVAATDTSGSLHLMRLSADGALSPVASIASRAAMPIAVAYAPDGNRLALAHFTPDRNGMVDILQASDGALLQTLGAPAIGPGRTQAVAWNAAGTAVLVSGARGENGANRADSIDSFRGYVREIDVASGAAQPPLTVASDTVTDLARAADGSWVYASFDASWGSLAASGQRDAQVASSGYVRRADRLWLAADSTAVQWQTPADARPRSFALAGRAVRAAGLADAQAADVPGVFSGTRDWESASASRVSILGTTVDLAAGEVSRAVTRIPGSGDVAWGTGHRLVRMGPGGRVVWRIAPGVETRAVTASRDGRLVVAAMSDGTLRWYRANDGTLLLSLYTLANGQWVLWSPRGYYDASPGSEQLIGWHVNGVAGQAAQFFSIGRFRERLHRPDVIDRLLVDADETLALQSADQSRSMAIAAEAPRAAVAAPAAPAAAAPSADIRTARPPTLVYRQAPQVQAIASKVELHFGLIQPPGQKLTSLMVRRDGILQNTPAATTSTAPDGKPMLSVVVEVPEGESVVHLVAANAHGYSDALAFTVSRPVAARPAPAVAAVASRKPRLFALVVGVGRYADARVNPLDLPAKDATDFAAVLAAQAGKAYSSVETRVLTDRGATREAIANGLAWLSRSVGERDFGFLYLAGHAVNHPNGAYYFLSHDSAVAQIASTSVEEGVIRSALVRLKGRAVLFVDTCHAGNAFGSAKGFSRDMSKIVNDLASPENGVIVFASSTGRQESLENADWGNGAFTKALVAGLQGGADLMRRGRVTFQGLGYYVSNEVEKLTRGEQTPVLISPPPGLPDFTLALMSTES